MRKDNSKRYRLRHPERSRLFRMVANLKQRKASPAKIRKYQELLKQSKLTICPKCGLSFRFKCE